METLSFAELVGLLEAQGISRTMLAKAAGVGYSTISNALAGRWVSRRTASAIAQISGTTAILVGDEFRFSGNVMWRT